MNSLFSTLAQAGPNPNTGTIIFIVIAVVVVIFLLLILWVLGSIISLYVQAFVSGAGVGIPDMIGMKLRRVDLRTVVLQRIAAVKAGLDIPVTKIETHYLAGGRVVYVIRALIAAKAARIAMSWETACAIDLAGRDILDAVQTSVNPKVIECPGAASGRSTIDAVAQDGIQLKAKALVTVRTNINNLIGGATEETIIARVGQGIVSTIGSASTHKSVLANPDDISRKILESGLDAGTAFEILSIDIKDVDVGENIGAKLQADQAETDKKRFQAEAEKRRALALALEQENKAKIQENRALVVLAEAEVPKAMADALRGGHFGVMDYYRLRNLQADTAMRGAIAGGESNPSQG
ncbi:MAG TPA: flotillin-like protein FloA [Phycisphaerales bacterium]|nr:flotillin-like protein FloA [Phycisphaerales bacterium]